jgi:hypothetical protein
MSFHTITMLTRWAVTADDKTTQKIEVINNLPKVNRHNHPDLVSLVKELHVKWSSGKKIEKLATFGWIEGEVCKLLDNLLYQLPELRKQYLDAVKIHGIPPELSDDDLERYEQSIKDERKKIN